MPDKHRAELQPDKDYYWENGLMVFTEAYHLKRGYCCNSGCRHCPFGLDKTMKRRKKASVSWSGGKDSALALYKIQLSNEFEIISLHTVIDESSRRVGLHGVHESLIQTQADHLGLPLEKIYLAAAENNVEYSTRMATFYGQCADQGIDVVVYGDIFLEDLRKYRLDLLKPSKLSAVFPLWKVNTKIIVEDFLKLGFRTLICAADASLFSQYYVGGEIDKVFLDSLPPHVDPCGENGEFHTFVYDGPIFKRPVQIRKGEIVKKTYSYQKQNSNGDLQKIESAFWFQDFHLNDSG